MKEQILELIYNDIEQMNETLSKVDDKLIVQTVINYAFDLVDEIKKLKEND